MSQEIIQSGVPIPRGKRSTNHIAFPRELRDAIPDLPTCVGRVLKLDSMSAQPVNTRLYGPQVQLKLVTKETGKLTGEYVVRVDLDVDAARALAATLTQLADQAEKLEPGFMM